MVGVSSAGIEDGQNINLAIPSNLIGEVARDKNISLYEMQTARIRQSATGQAFFYPDNGDVPDYGFITGYPEKRNNIGEDGKMISRIYSYSASGVVLYTQTMIESGYTILSQYRPGENPSVMYRVFRRGNSTPVTMFIAPEDGIIGIRYAMD